MICGRPTRINRTRRGERNAFDFSGCQHRDGLRSVGYRSIGGELTADVAPFGLRTTLRAGIRVSRTLTGLGRTVSEFILILP